MNEEEHLNTVFAYWKGIAMKWKGWKELKINRNWSIIYHDNLFFIKCNRDGIVHLDDKVCGHRAPEHIKKKHLTLKTMAKFK